MDEGDPKIAVPVADLRANLSSYLKKTSKGACFVIISRGKPVAELKSAKPPVPLGPRKSGLLEGKIDLPPDWDEWSQGILEGFERPLF